MNPILKELEGLLLGSVSRLDRLSRGALESPLTALGLSYAEFRLVGLLLGAQEGRTQNSLAQALGVKASTLSVALKKLEDKQLTVRRAHGQDRRAKRVFLKAEPEQIGKVLAVLKDCEEQATRGISAEELKTTQKVLRQMVSNLSAPEEDDE